MTTFELIKWLDVNAYPELRDQLKSCNDSEAPYISHAEVVRAMFAFYALQTMFAIPKGVREALHNHYPSLLFIWSENLADLMNTDLPQHYGGRTDAGTT